MGFGEERRIVYANRAYADLVGTPIEAAIVFGPSAGLPRDLNRASRGRVLQRRPCGHLQ